MAGPAGFDIRRFCNRVYFRPMTTNKGSSSTVKRARAAKVKAIPQARIDQLTALFDQQGYMRRPDKKRRRKTPASYKKGYEIRLIAHSREELLSIRRLLETCGIKLGRAFEKGAQWRQPIYGREQVRRLLNLVGADPETFPMPALKPVNAAAVAG